MNQKTGKNKEKGKRKKCRIFLNAIRNTHYAIRSKSALIPVEGDAVSRRFFWNMIDLLYNRSYNR